MDLSGKVIVITGATRGLGAALVQRLQLFGATVVGCALHGDPARSIQPVDVQDAIAVQAFLQGVLTEHGHIDVLINNAGYAGALMPLEDVSLEDYEKQMRTNVDGVFFMLQQTVAAMKKQKSGTILTIGSRAGRRAHPGLAVYSATKAAVCALTQALARELEEDGTGVRCIVISPGGIDTDMRKQLFGEEDSRRQQSADRVAELITGILTEDIPVPNGADVGIVRGEIEGVLELH